MSDWGVIVRSSTGDTLISPDSRTYEYVGEYQPTSRSGNINTYFVPGGEPPVIFAQCGLGNVAGTLAVEAVSGGYQVTVLSNVGCAIQAFRIMSGEATGNGVATYDRSGRLVFDSSKNVLNVRNAGSLAEGTSFSRASGVDMVSYTCGPVRPASSTADRWVFVETRTDFTIVTECGFETVCEDRLVCGWVQECRTVGVIIDGQFQLVQECYNNFVCNTVTECSPRFVCRDRLVSTTSYIFALVRRTNWSIDRGVARINTTTISFDWLRHLSGFYDTVIRYDVTQFSSYFGSGGVPAPSYLAPVLWITQNVLFEGALTANNTFPYTTSRANVISLSCLASVRSNYD
jgi:hypothetical protein